MPRYVVEGKDPARPSAPGPEGADPWAEVVAINARHGMTWIHSYVSTDRSRMFCVCEAATPEAVRAAARQTKLAIDRITEVRVLDPYLQL